MILNVTLIKSVTRKKIEDVKANEKKGPNFERGIFMKWGDKEKTAIPE